MQGASAVNTRRKKMTNPSSADERALFEAAMVEAGVPIFERHLFLDGKYIHQRDEDRFVGWKMARASLGAAQVPLQITVDFKQATELLEMFGGEPCEIALMNGPGHSGEGLYAVYTADPEGSVYLGETDEEAAPEAPAGAAQVPSLSEAQIDELRRVTASFASPWPDIEGEHVIIGRVKMAARYLQQHRALLHKVEALRAMIRTAVGAGIPDFREKFDAEILALFDVMSFAELYDAALSQPSQHNKEEK
jgi:hypothetical protein